MSDLRDFIQQHDPTSIGLYLVEFDRLVEQYEGEKARVKWLQSVVDEGETTERKLKEQLEALGESFVRWYCSEVFDSETEAREEWQLIIDAEREASSPAKEPS